MVAIRSWDLLYQMYECIGAEFSICRGERGALRFHVLFFSLFLSLSLLPPLPTAALLREGFLSSNILRWRGYMPELVFLRLSSNE